MTVRPRTYAALAGALAVNLILFALLPATVGKPVAKMDLESLNVVNMVELRRETPPPQEDSPPKEEPPREPPKELPPMSMPSTRPDIPKMDLVLPSLSFELNAKLATGAPVAAPVGSSSAPVAAFGQDFAMGEVDQIPMPLSQIKPIYPQRAKRMRLNGAVDVRFLVDETGAVHNVEIISARPEGVFDESVRKALSGLEIHAGPKVRDRRAHMVQTTIEFKFEG